MNPIQTTTTPNGHIVNLLSMIDAPGFDLFCVFTVDGVTLTGNGWAEADEWEYDDDACAPGEAQGVTGKWFGDVTLPEGCEVSMEVHEALNQLFVQEYARRDYA